MDTEPVAPDVRLWSIMLDMQTRPSEAIATLLQRLRQRQRVGQQELADLAGVSRTLITNIERGFDQKGRPTNPRPVTLRCLARGLATDGVGNHDAGAEERFYTELMVAAGHLPPSYLAMQEAKPWTIRAALRGRIPESLIDEIVEEREHDPLEDQQASRLPLRVSSAAIRSGRSVTYRR